MTYRITLDLPESLVKQITAIAAQQQQSLEDSLLTLIHQALHNIPLELLPDDQILAFCELQMPEDDQQKLSYLLAQQRETELTATQQIQLNNLMQIYREGLVKKAKAIQIAVDRKLRLPLNA